MAKLPEIDEGPVQESSGSYGQVTAAQQQTFGTIEKGLHMFGQELVKSQNSRAAADLLRGLEDTSLELRAKKTLSTQEVRDYLGPAYDSLPPEIKAQTVKNVFNSDTGQMETQDRDDVPMFAVAGHIYDEKAKKITAAASANLPPGWSSAFQDHAQHEIIQQKMLMSRHQLYDMHEYLQTQDTASAIDLANAGRYGEAKQVINASRTMDLAHKNTVGAHIDKIEDIRPLYESLRTGDIGTMAKQLVALGDEKQFTKLSPEERTSFTHRMEAEIKQFQDGMTHAEDRRLKGMAEAGWNGILAKERAGQPVSYNDIPMPGTVHADAQKSMIEYVDKLNKGEKPETDWKLYAGLLEGSRDRKKFSNMNLLDYRTRLADPEFKQLLELQQGMKGGNPDAYDHFQNTDEAINVRLASKAYNIDPKDKSNHEKVGYLKTLVQHDLAQAQETNGGKPLSLEERDGVIDSTLRHAIDPRKESWIPFGGHASSVPSLKAGVDSSSAVAFRRAVQALDPAGLSGNADKQTKTLEAHYQDYSKMEPTIEKAWQLQKGKNVTPPDAVRSWYYVKANHDRLEGALRSTGGWTDDKALRESRIVNLGVQEVLGKLGR